MSEERESSDPNMVKMYPKIHAAVIDSLGNQLFDARKQIDGLLAELGHERFLNGQLHTERDEWRQVASALREHITCEKCLDVYHYAVEHFSSHMTTKEANEPLG